MKTVLFLISLVVGLSAQATQYTCKDTGDGVCAVNVKTGQCTHAWSDDDGGDAMFYCKKFTGVVKSNYNPKNYKCVKTTNGVCAQSLITGQCTHEWSNDDGGDPLFFCKKYVNNK